MVEIQCENCYAFTNITKIEYLLFEEEAICSINIMTWVEHFNYCITTSIIQRLWVALGHATYSVWGYVGPLNCH